MSSLQSSLFGRLDRPGSAVLFAGMGGACEGILKATGVSPLVAINHDPHAIRLHKLNHPETMHFEEDVFSVPARQASRGRTIKLLWMSPDCTHFSRAKGKAPKSTGRRSLANVGIDWARDVRPSVIILENVQEFLSWGPLNDKGQPIKEHAGEYFREWCQALEAYGYQIEWSVLCAADYGSPTSRRRLFVVARCDGKPFIWPERTHGPGREKPYRTVAECIDWSLPMSSITDRRRPLSTKTLRRIYHGRSVYGDQPFLTEYYGTGLSASIHAPLHTITCVDRFGLVVGDGYRMLQPRELARAMGFSDSYILGGPRREQVARIGNAVCPDSAEALVRSMLGTP